MRLFSRLLPALLLTLSTTFAFAITNTFNGNGSFFNPYSWSLGVVPGIISAQDTIIINGTCTWLEKDEMIIRGHVQVTKAGVLNLNCFNTINEGGIWTIDGTANFPFIF
ncbi:MAG TPA: hypothetical protein VM888_14335, partial [Chitinophagaceae bacterium]|nr:hypothetical protein [Chitinophagaceae bacterium]